MGCHISGLRYSSGLAKWLQVKLTNASSQTPKRALTIYRNDMTNPLSNLKIDYWYKAVVVLSALLLVLSLTVALKGIDNSLAQLLILGAC